MRVRSRLLSYFRSPAREKAGEIARAAVQVAWSHTPNEFRAVVSEMKLIQRHRPPYNVEHKKRRPHVFIKLTGELAPRLLVVTRVIPDGSTYFGPYPRSGGLADAVLDLAYALELRDCAGSTPVFFDDQLEIFDAAAGAVRSAWCLRADLGSCLGPCCGRTDSSTYQTRARMASRFLAGQGRAPLRLLEARMSEAAGRLDFEYAARLRDRLDRLSRFKGEMTAFRGELAGLAFVYRVPGFKGDDRLYLIRRGRIRADLPHPSGRAAREETSRRIVDVYEQPEEGPDALGAEEAAEALLVSRWFRTRPRERRRTFGPREWLVKRGVTWPNSVILSTNASRSSPFR